jgi:NAD(P)-dependent dehydrogenase (short-subunit alcohol dehydrogenase family)
LTIVQNFRLDGRTGLVTGAGRGIGRASAIERFWGHKEQADASVVPWPS